MADLGVSQKALRIISEIEKMDGQKGISSIQERNALAEALANGKIDGGKNIQHVENLINEYDLKEAEKDASIDVINVVKKAMSMDGDKKAIDSDREEAVLDSIINNTKGQYSSEDIKYAKAMKKSFGLSESTPLQEANLRNEVLETKNKTLKEENQRLLKELDAREMEAQQMEEALNEKLAAAGEENSALKDEIQSLKEDIARYKTDCKNLKAKINDMNNNTTTTIPHTSPKTTPAGPNNIEYNGVKDFFNSLDNQKTQISERFKKITVVGDEDAKDKFGKINPQK